MILFACLPLLLSQAGAFTQRITLEEPCISIPKLLEKMSSASGSKLVADDDVLNDLMAIRVDGSPVSELMAHLADAEGSDWVLIGSTYHLKRSLVKSRSVQQQVFASRRNSFAKDLDSYRTELAKQVPLTANEAQKLAQFQQKLNQIGDDVSKLEKLKDVPIVMDPSLKAFYRILTLYTPEQLASIPPNSEQVFSLRPNRTQLALPDEAESIISSYVSEQKLLESFLNQEVTPADLEDGDSATSVSDLNRVLLDLVSDDSGDLKVTLTFADRQGRILEDQSLDLSSSSAFEPKPPPSGQKEPAVQLTEDEAKLQKAFYSFGSTSLPVFSDSIQSALEHPQRVPPANLFPGPLLFRRAQLQHLNLCAVLNDDLVSWIALFCDGNTFRFGDFKVLAESPQGLNLTEANGWSTMGPRDFDDVASKRFALKDLEDLVQSIHSAESVRIKDLANFTATVTRESYEANLLPGSYMELSTSGGRTAKLLSSYDLLNLYQSLRLDQIAPANLELRVRSLSAQQRSMLEHFVFAPNERLARIPLTSGTKAVVDSTNIRLMPTEGLPDGLPPDAILKITEKSEQALYVKVQQNFGIHVPVSLDTIARRIYTHSKLENPDMPYSAFQPAYQRVITFELQLSKDLYKKGLLREGKVAGDFVYDWHNLPAEYRDGIQKRLDAMK